MNKNIDFAAIDAAIAELNKESAQFPANWVYTLGTHEEKWAFRDLLKRFFILELQGGSYVAQYTTNFFTRHKGMGVLNIDNLRLELHAMRQHKTKIAHAKEAKLEKTAKAATVRLNKAEAALKAAEVAYQEALDAANSAEAQMQGLEKARHEIELREGHEWSTETLASLPLLPA